MEKDDIIDEFFSDLRDTHRYVRSEERLNQYRTLFAEEGIADLEKYFHKDDVAMNELDKNYLGQILTHLISNNKIFLCLKDDVSVSMIRSDKNFTCCFTYEDNNIILFDRNTMGLYWMLNKAFIYANENVKEEQILLFLAIILSYISKAYNLGKYSQPPTPPHKDKLLFGNLVLITRVQETFILAHEMAHIVSDEEGVKRHGQFIKDFFNGIGIQVTDESVFDLCKEIEADRIAFDAVLNAYQEEDEKEDIFVMISSSIFLLIRYHLWLTIAEHELNQLEDEYYVWLARNAFVRKYIDECYKWGKAIYIIEILEYLEDTLEIAALMASEILKKDV